MAAFDLSAPKEILDDPIFIKTKILLNSAIFDAKLIMEKFSKARNEQLMIDQLINDGLCREDAKALVKL